MKENFRVNSGGRMEYVSPVILAYSIKMEEGIAAASAEITSPSDGSTPEVEDWINKESDGGTWGF